jgi:HPt (histidine-containing phosphotransfer) domain-containing protein
MARDVDPTPIDWQKGFEQYGDEGMFHAFVEKFESDTFKQSIGVITQRVKEKNWPLLKREAHSLKGASGYSAATRCQELCEKLQFASQENPVNEAKVYQAYNDLMDHALALERYLCQVLKRDFVNPDGLFDYRVPKLPISKASEVEPSSRPVGDNTETIGYTMQRLPPPTGKFISPITRHDSEYVEEDANELDAYDELNKYWRCSLL